MRGRGSGFTLVELIACLAMLALAAGVVTFSLRGRNERAALLQALDRVSHADRTARQVATRTGRPLEIMFDLERSTVTLQARGTEQMPSRSIDLPRGVKIEQVYVGHERTQGGQVLVPCSTRGQTRSYALLLSSGQQRQWRLVAGLTGEHEDIDHAQDVEQIIGLCQSDRSDDGAGDDAD